MSAVQYVSAGPGFVALFVRRGKLEQRDVVAWCVYETEATAVTTISGKVGYPDAIRFPNGHVERHDGKRRWPTLESFCKDVGVDVPDPE